MSWWNRIWPFSKASVPPDAVLRIHFTMNGWTEQQPNNELRVWCGPGGAILSLGLIDSDDWVSASESRLREMARKIAASAGGGLIEVNRVVCGNETAVQFIYKRLEIPAYVFTGMFIIRMLGTTLVWTTVNGERGTTGVREAIVGSELFSSVKVESAEDIDRLWSQDRYDMASLGVDRSLWWFVSDGEEYDEHFPDHPLTGVRRFQKELCRWIHSAEPAAGDANIQ